MLCRLFVVALAFATLMASTVADTTTVEDVGEDDPPPTQHEITMEDIVAAVKIEALASLKPGQKHLYNCNFGDLPAEWRGSCDVYANGTIMHAANWSTHCDPWRKRHFANETSIKGINYYWGDWTCPEEHQDPSGCGDFRSDPRHEICIHSRYLDPTCTERVVIEVAEPLVPQKHACVQHPLFYDNYNTAGKVTPPIVGRHREQWAKWGEYEYIPPQRWLHSAEHGGIIFLYHHCLDEASLCRIRTFIKKWQDPVFWAMKGIKGGKFRFILTPIRDLQRSHAMVTWGNLYQSNCFNEEEMDHFILNNYRRSWEDFDIDGKYDYLWVGLDTDAKCRRHELAVEDVKKDPHVINKPGQKWEAPAPNLAEFVQLRSEQQTLRTLTAAALCLSVISSLVLVRVVCRIRPLLEKHAGYSTYNRKYEVHSDAEAGERSSSDSDAVGITSL